MTELTIKDIAALINDLKSEVEKRFDTLPESIHKVVQENYNCLQNHIHRVSDDLSAKLNDITDADLVRDARIDNVERLQLQSDLIIQGIPKLQSENINSLIQNICSKIAFDTHINYAITTCFRLKQNNNTKPPIIVKFISSNAKNSFLQHFGKTKGLTLADLGMDSQERIYINESLTKKNVDIFRYAMSFKRNKQIANVTTFNGLVHIRRQQTDSYIKITSTMALDELLSEENQEELEIENVDELNKDNTACMPSTHSQPPTMTNAIKPRPQSSKNQTSNTKNVTKVSTSTTKTSTAKNSTIATPPPTAGKSSERVLRNSKQ